MKSLEKSELAILYSIIEKLIGSNHGEMVSRKLHKINIEAYMTEHNLNFKDLLILISNNKTFYDEFISMITIHSTSWFREEIHFKLLSDEVESRIKNGQNYFRIWCAACSSGEEVYSIGLTLEHLKIRFPSLNYQILGSDIDPLSVKKAQLSCYPVSNIKKIPERFYQFLLLGEGPAKNYFTICESIFKSCTFQVINLSKLENHVEKFDFIFCRNVLIYFSPQLVRNCIHSLLNNLKPNGGLFLAQSEAISESFIDIEKRGNSFYCKKSENKNESIVKTVLVIDDVSTVRLMAKIPLEKIGFKVFEAADAVIASKIISENRIDLVTLDLNMPQKNGVTWLREIRSKGFQMPVVILSGSNSDEAELVYGAFQNGAQEFIEKRNLMANPKSFVQTIQALLENQDLNVDKKRTPIFIPPSNFDSIYDTLIPELIVIGASTGGPEALWKLLKNLDKESPPLIIIQHTNAYFADHFAKTIERSSGLKVLGQESSTKLQKGYIYLSHGDYHLEVKEDLEKNILLIHTKKEPINGLRPSIDILFQSIASYKIPCMAFLLTGIGQDGAHGMNEIFKVKNSLTLAQSEQSCVIFGMPKEAISKKCVHIVGDIPHLRGKLDYFISKYKNKIAGTLHKLSS